MKQLLEMLWSGPILFPNHIVWWNTEHGYLKGQTDTGITVYVNAGRKIELSRDWKKRQQRRIARTQRKR